jgi:hypothetical protein
MSAMTRDYFHEDLTSALHSLYSPGMRAWRWLLALVVTLAAPIVSCHSDATPSGPRWPGYPAFPFDLPLVTDQGGPKLTSPNLVVFVDPNDPQKPEIVAALAYLRTSDYWKTTTAEYGIGPIGDVQVLDPPSPFPARIKLQRVYDLVTSFVLDAGFIDPSSDAGAPPVDSGALEGGVSGGSSDGGATMVPLPTFHTETLYVVIVPPTTSVTDVDCNFGGEHYDVLPTATDAIPIAWTRADCPQKPDALPISPSRILVHEIAEAATDPFPVEAPGLYGIDPQHAVWNWSGLTSELADLCGAFPAQIDMNPPVLGAGTSTTPLVFPSIWSNQRAMTGLDPCLPVSANDPRLFIETIPVVNDQVTIYDGVVTRGVNVALNQTVTIPVRITADRPPTSPIMVSVLAAGASTNMPELMASIDPPTASNGDVVNLTLTRVSAPSFLPGLLATVVLLNATTDTDSIGFYSYLAVGVPPP